MEEEKKDSNVQDESPNESETKESPRKEENTTPTKESQPTQTVNKVEPKETKSADNNPKPTPATAPPKEQPKQEQSSGWGWGNWWNTATSTITQGVSVISETTTQLVRELVTDDQPAQTPPPKLYRTEEDIKKENEQKEPQNMNMNPSEGKQEQTPPQESSDGGDLDILSVVDKGFTLIGDSVDKLGNFLGTGISKVVESAPEIQAKAKGIASQAKEVAVTTAQKGIQATEKFATQSVDALETVGKHALNLLTVQETVDASGKSRRRPVFIYTSTPASHMTKEELASFEDSLNRNYFDEANGSAYLAELEKVSIECTLKFQKIEQKIAKADPKLRTELTNLLNKVKDIFEKDEGNTTEAAQVPLNESASKLGENIEKLAKEAHGRAKELIESFKQELRDFKPAESSASILTPTDIGHLTASFMDKTLLDTVSRLLQLSAIGVEQMLRIVESYLIENDSTKLSQEDIIKRAQYAFFTSQLLVDELNNIANSFIDTIKALSEEAKRNFEEYSKKGDAEKAEAAKCAEDVETKLTLHVNHINLDSSNAASNIEDARKFLFPVCKSLIASTFSAKEEASSS